MTLLRSASATMLASQWERCMPAGAHVAAFIQITVMWPGLLLTSHLCMT